MFPRFSSIAASVLRFTLLAVPLVATAHCSSSVEGDGESAAATTKEGQDAAAAAACPDGLVDVVRSDEKSGFLTFKVSDSCLNSAKGTLKDHVALESYLSKHPFTQLGKGEHFLMTCDTKYEIARRTDITQEQRRSVASNYYFLMNSLKQAALSTMESVAGLDMLVRPGQEPLQEIKGKRYSHPLLHESGDWEKRLKRNCRGEQARYDELVASTAMVVWNVRKLNAAIREHQAGIGWCGEYPSTECIEAESKHWKAIETLTKTRKAIVASAAPWLDGKKMSSLQSGSLSIGDVVKTENAYKLVDDQGVMQPRDKWHMAYHVDNPMNVIEKEIRAVFPAQLELNRDA
ncbi:MAG: hypothetical protein U0169_16545 [Polyangiaceae bacterium]